LTLIDRLPGILLAASLAAALVSALLRARRWRAGRPAKVDWIAGLVALPRRYLVDVHAVVLREPAAPSAARSGGPATARMHVLTAGGLVLATPLALLQSLIAPSPRLLGILLLAALTMMAAGVALLAWRRSPPRPSRLSGGSFDTLPWALCGFVAFLARATFADLGLGPPARWLTFPDAGLTALAAWACFEIFTGVSWGPMRHALAGALHLVFHPRSARFDKGRIDAALRPLALDAPQLGVKLAGDFGWNQLLGFDACVQCGRCEVACPAHAAGQPLNPKALIRNLAAAKTAQVLVGSGAAVEPDTLWACTTCRACVYECPMMIEHVDAVIDLRRFQTLELGATPGKSVQVLQELRAADTVCGRSTARRLDWAADLKLKQLAAGDSCDVLLWFGEAAFDLRGQRTLRALVQLLQRAGVDFAVLGADELDCGDLARRLGDEATFADLTRRNVATLASRRFARILTADPHVLHALRNEYPAFGGHYEVWHHSAYLFELIRTGRLQLAARPLDQALTFHDPCYLGRYNGDIESPRRLLQAIGIAPIEMKRSGLRSSCCGWGGGAAFTDVAGKRRIPDVRIDHARDVGAQIVAVACPNCAVMLEGVVAPRPAILDLAELVQQAVQAAEPSAQRNGRPPAAQEIA
jgi:N,N-dimethylglycine/sarcosine dehydrogenase ferredoxin subunit